MTDDEMMSVALREATAAAARGEVPVGAIVVRSGVVLAARGNEREATGDPTAHAEVLALRDAAAAVGSWRLDGCVLVSTLEPCPMCAGAMVQARVDRLVYGAADLRGGAVLSLYNIGGDPRLNHVVEIVDGVMADECGALLAEFFEGRR